jgi:hypothetical protein
LKPKPTECLWLPIRWVGLAALILASPLAVAQDASLATSSSLQTDEAPIRPASWVLGWSALALMHNERREQRGVPKLLPLMAAQTPHGRLWVGLARERGESRTANGLQIQVCWLVPLGP